MQHDHVLKKLNLDLLTPFPGGGVGVGGGWSAGKYTQTKKIRPIFMVLYLLTPIKMSLLKI